MYHVEQLTGIHLLLALSVREMQDYDEKAKE